MDGDMSSFIAKAISFRKAPSLIWSVSCQGIRMEAEETRLHRESGGQRMEVLWVDLTKNRFYDKKCYVFRYFTGGEDVEDTGIGG
jgi:hypothetical protein